MGIADKAKDALNSEKGQQKANEGLDKAADFAKDKVGDDKADKVDQARDKVGEELNNDAGQGKK